MISPYRQVASLAPSYPTTNAAQCARPQVRKLAATTAQTEIRIFAACSFAFVILRRNEEPPGLLKITAQAFAGYFPYANYT